MCFLEKKEFVFETRRDSSLNTQVINADTKEGDGPTIKIGMKLMRQQICFRITGNLGNSKGQHCSRQEKKKCIYEGVHCSKKPINKGNKQVTKPLGPSGRNDGSQVHEINKWALRR